MMLGSRIFICGCLLVTVIVGENSFTGHHHSFVRNILEVHNSLYYCNHDPLCIGLHAWITVAKGNQDFTFY